MRLCRRVDVEAGGELVPIDLTGKIAVVTGGASGIGLAAAQLMRACGARVAVLDRATLDPSQQGLEYQPVDVTDRASIETAFAQVEDDLGAVDVLVNSAGVLERPLPVAQARDKEWDKVISTNLRGTYLCCRHAGLRMAERGHGAIVNVSSVTGLRASPLRAYGPSKAAVINLTEGLAAEWARNGVRVNAVAPGFTRTPATDIAFAVGLWFRGWVRRDKCHRAAGRTAGSRQRHRVPRLGPGISDHRRHIAGRLRLSRRRRMGPLWRPAERRLGTLANRL